MFSLLHTAAHWNNFAQLAIKNKLGFVGWLQINFVSGPGWTGYIMLICLVAMAITALEGPRRSRFERFWYTHHLFLVFFFFWSFHGAFCMIKPDRPPFCAGIGVFWKFWIVGGLLYLGERTWREIRGKHRTYISKVIEHPSNVVEIQIMKERTTARAGQYIFLCCPEVSLWQYHPFTLTSAPEEDYISVHVRMVGDFTKALGKTLGCNLDQKEKEAGGGGRGGAAKLLNRQSRVIGVDKDTKEDVDPAIRRVLPRVYIDGPFGSASEDVFKYEVAVLVGAGIGVTPFASILKSIWYRSNYPQKKTRLHKVYFFWICRDFGSFEWFRSLLLAIEAQDIGHLIEIHTYLTARIKPDDATNIMINDANAEKDAITGLRAPTNFGRPNWDTIFRSIRSIHKPAEVGVFFCGPKALGSTLHVKCNQYSEPDFSFVWYAAFLELAAWDRADDPQGQGEFLGASVRTCTIFKYLVFFLFLSGVPTAVYCLCLAGKTIPYNSCLACWVFVGGRDNELLLFVYHDNPMLASILLMPLIRGEESDGGKKKKRKRKYFSGCFHELEPCCLSSSPHCPVPVIVDGRLHRRVIPSLSLLSAGLTD